MIPFLIAIALAAIAYFSPDFLSSMSGLSEAGRVGLAIFVMAATLWITEAVPLFVTALVIMLMAVLWLVGRVGPDGEVITNHAQFLHPFFNSTIALFLGGFIIARAVQKFGLDERIAKTILDRVGTNPRIVILAMMITTAVFSMFMSNTATTALMVTVALPVLKVMEPGDPVRKALLLGIPFAANIGGMGTPIGTPPNATAISSLADAGQNITFGQWMGFSVPIMLIALVVTWFLLLLFFKPRTEHLKITIEVKGKMTGRDKFVVFVILGTILAWLTRRFIEEFIPGISDGIIAMVPAIIFLIGKFLDKNDFNSLGWNVLFLMGGGLCLGVIMNVSGLNAYIVGLIQLEGLPFIAILLIFGALAAFMTTFISNTATASLLLPIVIAFSGQGYEMISFVAPVAVMVSLACSTSMILPVSTPPNAIAYGTGEIRVKDMARSGIVITIFCVLLIAAFNFLMRLIIA